MTNEVKNITLETFFLLHVDHLIKNDTGVDDKNAIINQNAGGWFENEWVVSEISNTTKPMFDYDMSVRVVMLSVLLGIIIIIIIIISIITITRPKPAYGRQGLAGWWGQDTDEVSTFWVFLTSHFAPAGFKPTWDH